MKEALLLVIVVVLGLTLRAQTFSEWFRQNSTQLKYLQEQVAALQAYMTTLQNGYTLVGDGLRGIQSINQADLDLHSGHFDYLKQASPGMLSNPRILAIRSCFVQLAIVADAIAREGALQPKGLVDWTALGAGIARRINQIVVANEQRLAAVLTDDVLEMSDAERAANIADIYDELHAQNEKAWRLLAILQMSSIKQGS